MLTNKIFNASALLVKLLYEEVAVFCVHASLYRGTQHIHTLLSIYLVSWSDY